VSVPDRVHSLHDLPDHADTDASVYTSFSFQYDFFVAALHDGRPTQEIDYAVSSQEPTFSDNNQTVHDPAEHQLQWPTAALDAMTRLDII